MISNASELLQKIKSNVSVDWRKKESVRAKMRNIVRRTLREHGYPPDLA